MSVITRSRHGTPIVREVVEWFSTSEACEASVQIENGWVAIGNSWRQNLGEDQKTQAVNGWWC
eukprot:7384002-Prymnesium_polylepis.1